MEIIVDVIGQRLRLTANQKDYVEGSQNFVKFICNFSEDWDDLLVFAQFGQNGLVYNKYLDEENCVYLPNEIQSGTCTMSLYGSHGNVIATTNHVSMRIDKGIVIDTENLEVSSSLYNQLVTIVLDTRLYPATTEEVAEYLGM